MSAVSRRTFLQAGAVAFALTKSGQAAAAGAALARLPYLQRLLAGSASVLWTSPQAVGGAVTITAPDGSQSTFPASVTPYNPSVTQLPVAYHQYQADITGLSAGTRYTYQVVLDGQVVAADPLENAFTTPAPGNMSFLVLGDSGADSPQQQTLIGRMLAEPDIAKVVHVGDLAYDSGTFAEFEANYFALNAPLMSRLSFFTTPGNHEYMTNEAAPFLAGHATPASNVPAQDLGRYYSYDWGDIHFASIDSNQLDLAASSRMLAWLDADLGATQAFWKIVFLHHPPYPTGAHLGDPLCAAARQLVTPIVESHGVQLVLSGHEHGYERSFPLVANQAVGAGVPSTTYVISGGGGYSLETVGSLPQCAVALQVFNYLRVDVTGFLLTLKAIGLDGSTIDMVTIGPPPVIANGGIVSSADVSAPVTAGSLVSIVGQNFAVRREVPPRPVNQLGGVEVFINAARAQVSSISPTRINLLLPGTLAGDVTFRVTTPNGSTYETVSVAPQDQSPVVRGTRGPRGMAE